MKHNEEYFDKKSAVMIVIANMIGTGVFTSLGFQLLDIQNPLIILSLWCLGGVIALCGALCYAELGAKYPRSGGEYNFLREIYHPSIGFISGWISVTVGFSAPTAAAAITACYYIKTVIPDLPVISTSCFIVTFVGSVHMISRKQSSVFQKFTTLIKIIFILVFVALVWFQTNEIQQINWVPSLKGVSEISVAGFAVSLIYVNYAYTGWNAATYMTGELDNPRRNLPIILMTGTAFVMFLYLLLNFTFLSVIPSAELAGKIEIGQIVSLKIFGEKGELITAGMFGFLLISTVSAMILAGPRALQMIGQDIQVFHLLSKTNKNGVPFIAIFTQLAITLFLIITSSFEEIILFSGILLALNSLVTVLGVYKSRKESLEHTSSFTMPFYPVPVIVYSSIIGITLFYLVFERPVQIVSSAVLIAVGFVLFILTNRSR